MDRIIQDLKSKEDGDLFSKVACDILRVVTLFGGGVWDSELSDTLLELWSLDQPKLNDFGALQSKVEKALGDLNKSGIMTSRKGIKADLGTQTQREELLHSIADYSSLMSVFGSDRLVLKYRSQT